MCRDIWAFDIVALTCSALLRPLYARLVSLRISHIHSHINAAGSLRDSSIVRSGGKYGLNCTRLYRCTTLYIKTTAFCTSPVLFLFPSCFPFSSQKNGALILVCCRGITWTDNMDELSYFDLTDGLDGVSEGKWSYCLLWRVADPDWSSDEMRWTVHIWKVY